MDILVGILGACFGTSWAEITAKEHISLLAEGSLRGRLRGADSMLEAVSSLQEWLNKIIDKGELYDQPQDDHGEEGFDMVASVESDSDEEPELVSARRLKMQQAVTWCEHNKGHLNGEKQVEKHERISNISTRAEEIYKLRSLKRTETGAAADNDSTDDDTPLWDLFRKAHDISSSDEEEYEVKEVLGPSRDSARHTTEKLPAHCQLNISCTPNAPELLQKCLLFRRRWRVLFQKRRNLIRKTAANQTQLAPDIVARIAYSSSSPSSSPKRPTAQCFSVRRP